MTPSAPGSKIKTSSVFILSLGTFSSDLQNVMYLKTYIVIHTSVDSFENSSSEAQETKSFGRIINGYGQKLNIYGGKEISNKHVLSLFMKKDLNVPGS